MASSTTTAAEQDALMILSLQLLVPVVLLALALNLWLACARPWEYYLDNVYYTDSEFEDLLLVDSAIDEDAPVPASRYNGVKEGPLSPDEVRRLINIIRADKKAPQAKLGASSTGQKRKAGDEASPISGASGNGRSTSPKSRKLKIETDFGTYGRWISEGRNYGSCIQEEKRIDGPSIWGEHEFTFRASHPDRAITSTPKLRG
ncbi:MAG: hypothetical protein LQ338_005040 [Usnochroma carphineum]|nr:MAG: hypothetical protein LQ338_005040 [Usnochroma carphineum]